MLDGKLTILKGTRINQKYEIFAQILERNIFTRSNNVSQRYHYKIVKL